MADNRPKLDRIDLEILAHLQKNGRVTNVDLADAVGLSASPCLMRVRRLEKAGYITGYGAHIQIQKLGDTLTVFTEVTLSDHRATDFARFEASIRRVDEIIECHLVSGGYDYLLKFIRPLHPALSGHDRASAGPRHRDREVFQLCRHQDDLREAFPPDREVLHRGGLDAPRRKRPGQNLLPNGHGQKRIGATRLPIRSPEALRARP